MGLFKGTVNKSEFKLLLGQKERNKVSVAALIIKEKATFKGLYICSSLSTVFYASVTADFFVQVFALLDRSTCTHFLLPAPHAHSPFR